MLEFTPQLATIFILGAVVIQLLRLVVTQMEQIQDLEITNLEARVKELHDGVVAVERELLLQIKEITRLPLGASSVEAAQGRGWAGDKAAKKLPSELSN